MPRYYEPDLTVDPNSPFVRDAANKLVRRGYWMDVRRTARNDARPPCKKASPMVWIPLEQGEQRTKVRTSSLRISTPRKL
jgi:hypothetical protein